MLDRATPTSARHVADRDVADREVADRAVAGAHAAPGTGPGRWRRRRHVLDLVSIDREGRASLSELDGVRACAVIAILVRHAWGVAGQPTFVVSIPGLGRHSLTPFVIMLQNGVDLFFVLSGFLLSASFFRADYEGRSRPDLRRYFRARAYRILPAYWVALFVVVVLLTPSLIPLGDVVSVRGVFGLLAHATVTQTLFLVSYGSYGVESPFWTLTIEVVFYAMLPWLIYAFYRNRWRIALPASVAITFVWLYLSRDHFGAYINFLDRHTAGRAYPSEAARYFMSKQLPAHLSDFAFGISVANIYCRIKAADRGTGGLGTGRKGVGGDAAADHARRRGWRGSSSEPPSWPSSCSTTARSRTSTSCPTTRPSTSPTTPGT